MVSINSILGTIDGNGIEVITTIECDEGLSILSVRSNSSLGRDWRYIFTDFDGDMYKWTTDQGPQCGKSGSYNPNNIFQVSATVHEIKQNGKHVTPMPEITNAA